MKYTVLSPWAEVNRKDKTGISPRMSDLSKANIGMFAHFMEHSVYMLEEIAAELGKRFPAANFSYIQYKKDTREIKKDNGFLAELNNWLDTVDCVIVAYGATPSCSLFNAYNAAYMEKRGKPVYMLSSVRSLSAAKRGAMGRLVPSLRIGAYDLKRGISGFYSRESIKELMADDLPQLADLIVAGLTMPVTADESNPSLPLQTASTEKYTGTLAELTDLFYSNGWTNGTPIIPPTEAAVSEMVIGSGLPRDYVIGCIPPMMGEATVEKIAINAVMAGCLPTYMPVLIAAVKAALSDVVSLEAWSCSSSTWGPMLTVSGSVCKEINMNTKDGFLSPYHKANSTIARAFGYIIMNIAGVRPGIEDLSEMGHEFRMGFCVAENNEDSPWLPLHTDFGYAPEDSAVTIFWPQEHRTIVRMSADDFLDKMCKLDPYGWDPGAFFVFTPIAAEMFAREGWTKQQIFNYIAEYARHPATDVEIDWLTSNNHEPESVCLPRNAAHSARIYWSTKHLLGIVGGGRSGPMVAAFTGGGDHGGPACAKIELPEQWDRLKETYVGVKLGHIDY